MLEATGLYVPYVALTRFPHTLSSPPFSMTIGTSGRASFSKTIHSSTLKPVVSRGFSRDGVSSYLFRAKPAAGNTETHPKEDRSGQGTCSSPHAELARRAASLSASQMHGDIFCGYKWQRSSGSRLREYKSCGGVRCR